MKADKARAATLEAIEGKAQARPAVAAAWPARGAVRGGPRRPPLA